MTTPRESLLFRVKAQEGPAAMGLRGRTAPRRMSPASWRTETPGLHIRNVHLLARVLLSTFPRKKRLEMSLKSMPSTLAFQSLFSKQL